MFLLDGKPYRDEKYMGSFYSDNETIDIELYGCEYNRKPHFHFIIKETNKKGCILLQEALYTRHKNINAKLSDIQCIDLDKFLRLRCDSDTRTTNWMLLCLFWNSADYNKKFKYSSKINQQPDYTKVNNNWIKYLMSH